MNRGGRGEGGLLLPHLTRGTLHVVGPWGTGLMWILRGEAGVVQQTRSPCESTPLLALMENVGCVAQGNLRACALWVLLPGGEEGAFFACGACVKPQPAVHV